MIMRHIDRSRSTGGGMLLSFALHGGLLLILGLMAGHQAAMINDETELNEIAYIEATYGEDVAAKVKLKQKPKRKPKMEPAGRGINTDSAFKPKAPTNQEPVRPKAMEAVVPELVGTLAAAPKLQQAKPKARVVVPKPAHTTARPVAAKVEVVAPVSQPSAQPKVLAAASQLENKAPRPKARKVIDAGRLGQPVKTLTTAEANAPQATSRKDNAAFKPQSGGLKSRTGTIAAGEDVLADSGSAQRRSPSAGIAEASAAVSSGGNLKSAGRGTYSAPQSGLTPSSGRPGAGKAGVVDVAGPSGGGSTVKKGRKTVLDYGSGGGGRGGSLNSRQRIAEPAVSDVMAKPSGGSKSRKAVAEVKLDAKDVNMSITGQIQGRKILQSFPAVYSAKARKKGWEGVVAVHFTVLADGRVKDNVYFEQTSVHRDLNQAAMKAIKKFKFAPLGANKAAVEQWGVITIVFKLK